MTAIGRSRITQACCLPPQVAVFVDLPGLITFGDTSRELHLGKAPDKETQQVQYDPLESISTTSSKQ
ncbi:hypothetical protein ASPCADRAFT_210780 [Aspergillus carbonarius ITEM 5010]|uniref:Uncharacterized protein n=1 Tax=Aspergillus carbonarius (strain ITEM 5010) TaxID=602072 RepID=A0A1R3RBM3_ASPC5|nr:hypothetical protein ASPCADRAFT_210780 [Aspergillus carbonarius ITEM 5010]